MESLEFVQLAVSKDESRYNLTSVYRDTEYLVATDGNRLHYSNGLQKLEKGHFLNGLDAEFPIWKPILPTEKESTSIVLGVNKELMSKLKAFEAISKTINRSCPCRFSANKDKLTLQLKAENIQCELHIPCSIEGAELAPEMGLNLSYVMDIFKACLKANALGVVEIRYYGDNKPWAFEIPQLGKAIIMPLRLSK